MACPRLAQVSGHGRAQSAGSRRFRSSQLGFVKPHRLSLASTSAAHFTDQKRRIRAACRCGVRLRGLVDVDITFTTFRHSATRAIAAGVPGPATRSRAREHELDQRRAAK